MKAFSLGALLCLTSSAAAITERQATHSFNTLQQWYNESIGLWIPSTGWWNSANCTLGHGHDRLIYLDLQFNTQSGLTVIADLAQIDSAVAASAESVYPNTFVNAQEYNLDLQKDVSANFLTHCHYRRGGNPAKGFLNE